MPAKIDLTGHTYGRLFVLNYFGKKNKIRHWLCKCECGNEKTVSGSELRSYGTQSCGCLLKEKITHHGKCRSRVYSTYRQMISRCHNKTNAHYKYYGLKGIEVCEKWRIGFIEFYNDMGDKPSNKHTLDRIDNSKGYYKENCRWVTMAMQSYNKTYKKRSMPMGVSELHTKAGTKYFSHITIKRKRIYIGCFDTKEQAHLEFLKRREAAIKDVEDEFNSLK